MSLLTPHSSARRRAEEPPTGTPIDLLAPTTYEWHVGLSREGMFPHREAQCPCAKAACGLAIPRDDTPCPVHQGEETYYPQAHLGSECEFPRKGWRRRRSHG
jgi:hypothetical protein